jgi:ketosteroid isomerase-like protein
VLQEEEMTTRAEVETNNADFCAALGRGDIERVVSSFDEEAVMLAPGAPLAHGSGGIREYFAQAIAGGVGRPAEMRTTRIDELADGAVAEVGDYTMTIAPPDAEPFEDFGKYMVVHRRDAHGRLRIWRDMFHSDRQS